MQLLEQNNISEWENSITGWLHKPSINNRDITMNIQLISDLF